MISVNDALQTVLTASKRLSPIILPLHDSLGKVLAQDVRAPDPLPPYPASSKVPHSPPSPPFLSFLNLIKSFIKTDTVRLNIFRV